MVTSSCISAAPLRASACRLTPPGSARRRLALRLGTLPLARRLIADSSRSPRRAIGPAEVIRATGSTWWEVDAETSLRASFGCAGPTAGSAGRRQPTCRRPRETSGMRRAGRVCQADASRRRKSGGAIHPRVFPQRVRVVANQLERFEPRAACRRDARPQPPGVWPAQCASNCDAACRVESSRATSAFVSCGAALDSVETHLQDLVQLRGLELTPRGIELGIPAAHELPNVPP